MDRHTTFFVQSGETRRSQRTGFGLPPDLLDRARHRVKIIALLVLVGAGADFVTMVLGLAVERAGHEVGGPGPTSIPFLANVVSITLAIVVLGLARSRRIPHALLLDIALIFEVVLCAILSVSNPLAVYGDSGALPPLTWVTPLIILFPLIVPCPPRRILLTSILAAATRPLGLALLAGSGWIQASAEAYFSASFSPAIACVIAFHGARVVYGLGLEVAEARRMGSYRLERRLGRGGMGEVWVARHRMLARPAAVKLVRPEFLGTADVGQRDVLLHRFEREAQATASMRSPHTIGVYDFGVTAEGAFYYVMELLEGLDADALVQRFGPVPPERAVYLLRQICHSLAEAHEAGLIHRDIKPANVYVCRYGRDVDFVKVLDFGLVKTMDESEVGDVKLTAPGLVGGTPAFMAPEQATGGRHSDARSDIYAVGCVAYWLLTGQLVFEGSNALEVLMHHMQSMPVPPSRRAEIDVPEPLDRLVLSCLEKDPGRRPQSAHHLSDALAACGTAQRWDQPRARRWWESHHPQPCTPSGSNLD